MSFGIGIIGGKTPANLGTLWRSAYQLGADFVFTVGHRYKRQPSDTYNVARQIPHYEYVDRHDWKVPVGFTVVAIELAAGAESLVRFSHPRNAVYVLGAEDHGLPEWFLDLHTPLIQLPFTAGRPGSYNVAVAGSLVMYDRLIKGEG
jgi:tRNA G18 (ribose-2'-O)-methylase SpoU